MHHFSGEKGEIEGRLKCYWSLSLQTSRGIAEEEGKLGI